MRGYGTARRFGRYAWSASVEYRFPIRLVNRGLGLFPLHLDWVAGAVFLDGARVFSQTLERGRYVFEAPLPADMAALVGA